MAGWKDMEDDQVTMNYVLEVRPAGLSEAEIWALLCQATQALQDMFLTHCVLLVKSVPRITPTNLKINDRGRVILDPTPEGAIEQRDEFMAPEYRLGCRVPCDDTMEKMLIFSLGKILRAGLKETKIEQGILDGLLASMVHPDPNMRASLMDLLDAISEYCKARDETLPFSYIVTDLFWEVLDSYPLCLRNMRNVIQPSNVKLPKKKFFSLPKESKEKLSSKKTHSPISKSYSLTNRDERPALKNPVRRAPSRLYRAASASSEIDPEAKYCCPNTCIGPEFIVRGRGPSKVIHIEGVKTSLRKKVIVLLLTGQKLLFTCNPNTTTAGKLFEVLINSEGYEDNFTLGLAALLGGDFAFLPNDIKIHKLAPSGWRGDSKKHGVSTSSFTLYLRVKYFLPTLRVFRNWTMKHLMYLQMRRRLLEQLVQCDIDDHVTLGGLALQAEFGDYSDEEHGHCDYFLMEHYIPEMILLRRGDGQLLKTRMQLLHKERKGLDPGRAEEIYISLVQTLQDYNSHFYNAKWEQKQELPMLIAINSEGITLYRNFGNERSLHKFFEWKNIKLLSYSKHYLFITPQNDNNDNKGTNKPIKYKLKMDHKKSMFVFHLASIHHQFSMKLRSDMNSLHSLIAEFGVPIRSNCGEEEDELCCSEDNEYTNRRSRQILVTPAISLNGRSTDSNSEKRTIVLSQREKDCSVVSGLVNVEDHQNKENENPVNVREQKEEYCSDCKLDLNEWPMMSNYNCL